jgi:hypothetical protein
MTSQSPRIYIYKITFEEVLYYYYGVHKEKVFGEEYWGSPKTHKWCWELYSPKKQILQFFDFTDEGWLEAQTIESRLIRPFFNDDKWCLNESCGGKFSIKHQKEAGRKGGSIGGRKSKELGVGVHGRTKEQMAEDGKSGGKKIKELGIGVHGRTKEQIKEDGKKGGQKSYKLGVGVHALTKEQMTEDGIKGGKIGGKKTSSQKWKCLETGFITNAGNLTQYQKARGIDTTKRIRLS